MFKVKDKNGVEALLPKYVAKCTTVGSGNIFVGKAKNRFVKQADGSFVGLASGKNKDETIHISDMPLVKLSNWSLLLVMRLLLLLKVKTTWARRWLNRSL